MTLIDDYLIDTARPLPDAGIAAFAAVARRDPKRPLMAQSVHRHAPPRARALQTLTTEIEGLLTPLASGHGPPVGGNPAWFVICQAPPGPPVSANPRPWPEQALIEHVMRPIAGVLEDLHTSGLTHRAIRPDNVFAAAANRPVILGAAWAAPPAMHQPAVCEPAYSAMCHPNARGDGRIADDVYALGVLLAALALGRMPMAGLDDAAILQRKLELGDFAAVAGQERLPPALADLIRGMLAEDPDHRPHPSLLRDPAGVRGRRIAARPPPRAAKPFRLGTAAIWNNRTLAHAMATEPAEALSALQSGTAMFWLRRGLGETALAVRLEELVRQHNLDLGAERDVANATLIMRSVAATDPFMPLCWRGLTMFPDGLGTALAAGPDARLLPHLLPIVATEAIGTWAGMKEERTPAAPARVEARQHRAVMQIKGPAGGLPRLTYALNPLLPCASPLLEGRLVVTAADLPMALDAAGAAAPDTMLLEPHVVAFLAARSERWLEQEVKAVTADGTPAEQALNALRLLSELQTRFHPAPLPGLSGWAAKQAAPLVQRWKNRARRAAVEQRLATLSRTGQLPPILALLADSPGQAADAEGLRAAQAECAWLDAALLASTGGGSHRAAAAAQLGQEIAAGVGLTAIAVTLVLAALG